MKSEGLGDLQCTRRGFPISPECGVRFTGSRKDGDQRRVTSGAQLPRPDPQPPPTPVHAEEDRGEQKPAFLRGGCLGIRARWGWGSGLGFLLLFFIGKQNLGQECQQLRHGQIPVLWSLNIIKLGGGVNSLREKNTNAIGFKLLLLKSYFCNFYNL